MRRKSLVGLGVLVCLVSLSASAGWVPPEGASPDTPSVEATWTATLLSPLDWIRSLFDPGDPPVTPPVLVDGPTAGGDLTTQSSETSTGGTSTEAGPGSDPDG